MTDRITEIREKDVAWINWGEGDLKGACNDRSYLLDQIAERDAEIERLRKHWETSTENARWFADKAEANHDEYPGEALGRESMKKWKLNSERCKVCGVLKADCPGWHMEGNTKVYHSYGDYCD